MSFNYSCYKEDIYLYYGMPQSTIKKALIGITFPDPTYEITRNDSTKVYSIEYVYSGECVIQHGDKIFIAKAGDLFILHPHTYHHYYNDPKNPCKKIFFCMEFGSKMVSHLVSDYNLNNVTHFPGFNDPSKWEECYDAIKNNDPRYMSLLPLNIHAILAELADKVAYSENTQLHSISMLKDFMERNITRRITIEECCELTGLEKSQLISTFKQVFTESPITYFLNLKIQAARTMLEKTNNSIAEIAAVYDFYDQFHFSKTFKKYTGFSPTEYRKLLHTNLDK